jgi:hypothetical protein
MLVRRIPFADYASLPHHLSLFTSPPFAALHCHFMPSRQVRNTELGKKRLWMCLFWCPKGGICPLTLHADILNDVFMHVVLLLATKG